MSVLGQLFLGGFFGPEHERRRRSLHLIWLRIWGNLARVIEIANFGAAFGAGAFGANVTGVAVFGVAFCHRCFLLSRVRVPFSLLESALAAGDSFTSAFSATFSDRLPFYDSFDMTRPLGPATLTFNTFSRQVTYE